MRSHGRGARFAIALVVTWLLAGPQTLAMAAEFPEEAAQKHYLEAMRLYDSGQYDNALRELKLAEKAVKNLPDKAWRASTQKVLQEAELGILYEAGLARFRSEVFDRAYDYFDRCLAMMPKGDSRRPTVERSLAKSAYMQTLQLWLAHKYDRARDMAREAQKVAARVYKEGGKERQRLDEVHYKITMAHTEELVSQGEIQEAYAELKKDFELQADPRFAYQLGELGTQLRAFGEAERYYTRAGALAEKALAGGSGESELRDMLSKSEERLVHIRSLRRTVVVKSNVPYYQVEVYRPFTEQPLVQQEPEDPTKGAVFHLYPGRYRIKVLNADYGVCVREEVPLGREDLELECSFEKPPTAVSFDTTPSGIAVKVVPSTMVAMRRTPFYTELHRGSYTLLADMEGFPGPIKVPFVVENEGTQEFHFDLDFGELDVSLAAQHQDAQVRVNGRMVDINGRAPLRVGLGSQLVEVEKFGYQPVRQRVFINPRETKTLFLDLQAVVREEPERVVEAPLLDLEASYFGEYASYRAVSDKGGKELELNGDLALHHVQIASNIYLTGDKAAAIKPYLRFGADIAFSLNRPIQSVLGVDAQAGFGVLFDQLEQSRWRAVLSYRFDYLRWNDKFPASQFELSTIHPLGLSLEAGGHYSMLQAELDFGFSTGSGRRDDFAAKCSTDVSLTWFGGTVFLGADLVDAFGYNPDFDVALGATGGVLSYSEEQSALSGGCEGVGPQGIDLVDGTLGTRLRVRYQTRTFPRTAFVLQGDVRFLGGLLPEVPVIYDDKTDIQPTFGNVSLRGGIEVMF